MRKTLALLMGLLMIVSCSKKAPLQRGQWDEKVYSTLNELILTYGSKGKAYDPSKKAYAVFDYDNTTIMNDVELSMMTYLFDNLKFKVDPEKVFEALTCVVPDLDKPLKFEGKEAFTSRDIAEDLASDYKFLCAKGFQNGSFRSTDEFKDFRAKMFAYYNSLSNTFDYAVALLMVTSMLDGMTAEDVDALTRESFTYAMAEDKMYAEIWESPEMGKAGKVKVHVTRGMTLTPEMIDLYKTLEANGIDVYICSASHEFVVEAMACDPAIPLGMDKDRVFGIRVLPSSEGGWATEYVPGYKQTYQRGKVEAIREYIAPLYGGQDPVLVAGDSSGDYNMLTELPGLKVGLIVNCMRGGKINDLMTEAVADESKGLSGRTSPLYVVQGRNAALKSFIPSWDSVPVI
ncbi:MAG: haloacid dehalogenase-like hydrolase [Bacteroidales bacterium]|nr:haloacid dehalogenase-like hydrolase [Bacteroidales bacterium]